MPSQHEATERGALVERAIAALLAATLAGGCSTTTVPPPSPPLPPLAEAAAPPVPGHRILVEAEIRAIAELLLMEDRRTLDLQRMGDLIRHWSVEVRRRAALATGRIGDRRGTPLLLEALRDTSSSVVADATFALGRIGDTTAVVVHTLDALLADHADDSIGVEIVAALTRGGTQTGFAALIDALAGRRGGGTAAEPGLAQREALLAIWRFPQAGLAVETIAPYLQSGDAEVRWRAVYALVRPGIARALPRLIPMAFDPDAGVRALVARSLRASIADSVGERTRAREALLGSLRDPVAHVRINALGAIATWSDPALADAVAMLMQDADANVRVAAAQALGSLRSETAADPLARAAADGSERMGVRATALMALVAVDSARGSAEAARWASSSRWLERLHGTRSIASLRWTRSRQHLVRLVSDPDPRVARAALAGVSRLADSTTEAHALFLQGLRARDPTVRAAAIAGLGRQRSPANLAALMDAYDQARRDTSSAAAAAAIDALAALRTAGVPVENAFFTRFPAPADPELRRRAERRLGGSWLEPAPDSTPVRGAAFYEMIVRTLVAPALAGEASPILRITTDHGDIDIRLAPGDAPLTVHNIITLVASGYFDSGGDPDSRRWHRVVPNFVLQDGDPRGDGSGGPGYAIRDEINRLRYHRGVLGMALSGPDTGGSQFFITHSPQPHLDGGYTIFGTVVSGMDAADGVVQDDRIIRMQVITQ